MVDFPIEQLRPQFPSLVTPYEGDSLPIFLDNPAGTQVPQRVIDAVHDYYVHMNANAGGFFETSRRNDAMVQAVRQQMADFLNAPSPDEIVFGPNMTTLNFALSRALAKTLSPGDEIILTRMDHDANITPWIRIAEDYNFVVRWVDIIREDATLDLSTLEDALSSRTKIVATTHASNAVGTINPIRQIGQMAHAVGALYVVDAVQSAPHVPIDVQAIDCDFLLCSVYKFYGPHIGILWGRYDLLAQLPAYKVRPAKDVPPYRWETGTQSFETIAAVGAALDYLASIADITSPDIAAWQHLEGQRLRFKKAMEAIVSYEKELVAHLTAGLQNIEGMQVVGIVEPERYHQRVSTVACVHERHTPAQMAQHLAANHIYAWSGHYYAVEIVEALGYAEHGMLRLGIAHYNTHDEIDRTLAVLQQL